MPFTHPRTTFSIRQDGNISNPLHVDKRNSFVWPSKRTFVLSVQLEVAQDYEDAMQLDKLHKHNKWQKSIDLEMVQIDEYTTFKDLGHKSKVLPPPGHKRISVHLVFDVKHDGRYKA